MRCGGVLRAAASIGMICGGGESLTAAERRYAPMAPPPERLLREMTTDRPDTTETPFTIDAGHVQIESTLFGFSRSRADVDGAVTDGYEFVPSNVRIGLRNDLELSLVWQPYGVTRTRLNGVRERQSGIGKFDVRAKVNVWGNDDFDKVGSALALLPFVTLPTDEHNGISPDYVEGGFIVPFVLALPNNFGLGINGSVVWLRDEETSYRAEYTGTASLAYEWTDKLDTYGEIVATFDTGDKRGNVVVLGGGATYAVTDNLQLDAGINLGVTEAADRFNSFIGVSQRF